MIMIMMTTKRQKDKDTDDHKVRQKDDCKDDYKDNRKDNCKNF